MHYYASDSAFRGANAFFILAVVATLLAYAFGAAFSALKATPPWWMEVPSVLGIYGLVVAAYDHALWRLLSNMPVLTGTWLGEINSSFEGERKTKCIARIRQSWTRMSVELETDQSLSRTTMAALFQETAGETGLNYEYLSEPKTLAKDTMQAHRGTAHLRISDDCNKLTGSYYSGRGRGTLGEISLTRISSELLDYEAAQGKEKA